MLGLAAASVIAVMVIQFQSFIEPLVVLLAAPLSFVGAIGLLLLTGTPLNVSSFMGLILLVGLIVKNGIILLDFTRHVMRNDGLPLAAGAARGGAHSSAADSHDDALHAVRPAAARARASARGATMQRPLALAVIGGLALSTPITLFVVPTLLVAIRGREYAAVGDRFAAAAPTRGANRVDLTGVREFCALVGINSWDTETNGSN